MWFDEAGEVVEMFKSSFPLSILFFVPIFIIISPVSVGAAHEFAVYRMQQYDLQGSNYGCRNALINVEARSVDASMYSRRCVVSRLREFTIDKFKEAVDQSASGLLVLLPKDLAQLPAEDQEHLRELEYYMMQEETQVPVYFSVETPEVLDIYNDVKSSSNSDAAGSAAEALLGSASANGFQMVVAGPQSKLLSDFQVVNLQGKLTGQGIEEQLPTVAIVAHYDAYGVASSLSFGADSNGSGVVALLELARLFSKLYTNSRTHAKFNLLFLLSGAGKFNYQGTKRWIEDQLESSDGSLLSDVSAVLCLDSLGNGDALHLHVSKPPREGSAGDLLYKNLEETSREFYDGDLQVAMVHKKINLADDFLGWEHERFSIKRLPAFTLSRLDSPKARARASILDTRVTVNDTVLARNVKVLAESLARYIFNLSNAGNFEIFDEGLKVEPELLSSWLDYLAQHPRSAQLLSHDSTLVTSLEQAMARFLKDVKKHTFKADKRDPEFGFYSGSEYTMNAYSVKPAVFDLFLALGISAYLALLYLIVQNFHIVYSTMRKVTVPVRMKKTR